ncbi:hypothetical protein GCM10009069_22610 [Algimonas arctica]|uniref:Uncharacterized protein n=1 Tax=Algimonas arctica TaxID=1479486 RepID=A0A8J3G303_9PROT|nr:hypothetical protein [Algimonas arctica]GHA99108.1 hypothetical protein GCM10009069_22610 [Algimonas arctica]
MASKNPQNTSQVKNDGDGLKSQSKEKMTPDEQSARFIETARELECDESGKKFKTALKLASKIKPKN